MKNRFDREYAKRIKSPLELRVYTSRLLGADEDLVLHGGGNTSLKYGDTLYVKGSGWDLGTIEEEGFAPVDLESLLEMAEEESLSDREMVARQRKAMKNENAPNPSVEAILHAIIPHLFVDHTHADAVVTLSNTPDGREILEKIYGDRVLIVDYVMPGFKLARAVHEMTRDIDWEKLDGIILMHHGIFTFGNDAEESYNRMIELVTLAENYIESRVGEASACEKAQKPPRLEPENLAEAVSRLRGKRVEAFYLDDESTLCLSQMENLERTVKSGGLTPEHVIRIKPFPMVVSEGTDLMTGLESFADEYEEYFASYASGKEIRLDSAPRWAIIENWGVLIFCTDEKERKILSDIVIHTARAMLTAQKLGGWSSLSPAELFEMEYWELEQAKLKREDR